MLVSNLFLSQLPTKHFAHMKSSEPRRKVDLLKGDSHLYFDIITDNLTQQKLEFRLNIFH